LWVSCQTRSGTRCVRLARLDHGRIISTVSGRDREAEPGEAGREARHAQDPHRVLGEGRRNVAQHPRLEVAAAAPGVHEPAFAYRRASALIVRSRRRRSSSSVTSGAQWIAKPR
jgi:hypothetical protein